MNSDERQNQVIDLTSTSSFSRAESDGSLETEPLNDAAILKGEQEDEEEEEEEVPTRESDERDGSDAELARIEETKYGDDGDQVPAQGDSENGINSGSGHQRSTSPGSVGSAGSGSKGKRRSWKKPKDKPKRPLSAYNIFFKHERTRIVEGKTGEATPEETIRSIEYILSTSRETRRHRKTHGRITFGDLARRIADKWKAIAPEQKAMFDHYASIDMRRYRKEVQHWKDRKEYEAIGGTKGLDGSNASYSDSISDFSDNGMNGSSHSHSRSRPHDPWAPRQNFYDSMNNSVSSVDSEFSMDPLPIRMMRQQQQLAAQQQRNSQEIFHQSMPNLRGNFLQQDNGMMMPSNIQSSNNNNMFLGMQQQLQQGGGGTFDFEPNLSPMDLSANANANDGCMSNMMMGTLNREQLFQQQQMMLQNQFEMGFQQQNQMVQMNTLHNSFSGGRPSRRMQNNGGFSDAVPMFVGSSNSNDMNGSFAFQQRNNTQMGMQAPVNPVGTFSFHSVTAEADNSGLDPVPFNEVFPDETNNPDLQNYLSNLDLSQM